MPQAYHTGHIRMGTFDLNDTKYAEGTKKRRQNRGSSAKIKGSVCFCLQIHRRVSSFWNYQSLLKQKQSQSRINLFFSFPLNPTSAELMQLSSLPMPFLICFFFPHTRHVYSWPSFWADWSDWGDSTMQMPDQGCSLPLKWLWLRKHSHSITRHSLVCVSARRKFTGTAQHNHHRASALWINGTCCKHYTPQHASQAAPSHLPITQCWAHAQRIKTWAVVPVAHGKVTDSSGKKREKKKKSSHLLLSVYHFGTKIALKWFTGADRGWQDACLFGSCCKIPLSENWQLTLNTVPYYLFTMWHRNVLSSLQPWNRWNQQFRERSALFQQKKCSLRGLISRSHLGGIDAVALTHRSSRLTYWPTVMLTSLASVFTKVISCKRGRGDLSHENRQHLLAR